MERIEWSALMYGTGVSVIDEQHQELFRRINALFEGIERGLGKEDIDKAIAHLTEFAVSHFSCEERIMEDRKCSSCQVNKTAHGRFLAEFTKLVEQFRREGCTPEFAAALQDLVMGWLRTHIMIIDKKLQDTVRPGA